MTTNLACIFLCLLSIFTFSNAARTLNALVEDQAPVLTYHNGALLTGRISINLIFYGKFTAAQKSIVADFITSLSIPNKKHHKTQPEPSVSKWWHTLSNYYNTTSTPFPRITLGSQHSLSSNTLAKTLSNSDILNLAALGPRGYAVNVVLTAPDVAVEKFCMSRCGSHSASPKSKTGGRFAYIWVGNSATQCPGQCAWPFHQPIYGPQVPPLVAPNGDVGIDGIVINLAALLAGTFTNPFGNGYFQGDKEAPLEAVTACPGVYGKGAYPGYAGDLLVDEITSASYNANGVNGRKYLLPAVFDPATLSCSTLV